MESTGGQRRHVTAFAWLAAAVMSAVLISTGGAAWAADGIYVDLSVGGGVPRDLDDSDGFTSDFSPGPTISGAVGYKWRWLRVEGEIFYTTFGLRDQIGPAGGRPSPPPPCFLCGTGDLTGSVSALTLMANAYLDLDLTDNIRLYLGGGIGRAQVSADYHFNVTALGLPTDDEIPFVDDGDNVLAYQARIGIVFGVTERSEYYLGYRYFATGEMGFDVAGGGSLDQDGLGAHIAEIGVRYHF